MRYEIFKVLPQTSYIITIESKFKPDSSFRERVRSDIDRAMSNYRRELGASHAIAFVTDPEFSEQGEDKYPTLLPGGQYLIFALFSSGDSAESGDSNLSEAQREIEESFRGLIGEANVNDIYIGLVLLRDCSVKLIGLVAPNDPHFKKGWIMKSDSESRERWITN